MQNFSQFARSDGVALDLVFSRPPPPPAPGDRMLDFQEVPNWGLDPGRGDIFSATTADRASPNGFKTISFSVKSYYEKAGLNAARRERENNLKKVRPSASSPFHQSSFFWRDVARVSPL